MSLQNHFVVVVEDGMAYVDYDVSLNFDNGDVWDTETEQWYDRNDEEVSEVYEKAEEKLLALLKQTWVAQ